jgi:hypothetical protein
MPTQFRQHGTKVVPKLLEKTNIADIVDNLSSGGTGVPLSAEQGKSLNVKINTETVNRQQAIIDLKGGVSVANDTLKKVEDNLALEVTNRTQAIANEATARTNADNALRADFEAADAVMSTNIADATSTLTNSINAEAARAIAAETVLSDDLAQEVLDRQTAVSNEATARVNAVAAEKTRAEAAESANANAIANEATRAQTAETTLSTAITAESDRAQGVETTLSNAINTERTQRIDNDTSLDSRLNAIENGLVAGLVWQAALPDMAALDALDESAQQAGWAYYVGAEKDVYVVIAAEGGDHQPASWTTKSFLKFADFAEVTGLIQAERTRALTAEAGLTGSLQNEVTRAQTAEGTITTNLTNEVTRATNAEANLQANIDAEATARIAAVNDEATRAQAEESRIEGLVTQEATDRATAVTNERNRATAAEEANATAIATEISDRTTAVTTERNRAQTAEATLTTNLSNEISNRTAAVTAEATARNDADVLLGNRLGVIEGSAEVEGSVLNAISQSKQYTLDYMPRPKVEGIGGSLIVQGDTVTVSNVIFDGVNGVIFGEVIVYAGDNNQEAVACHITSVSGSVITLAVQSAGEFNGKAAKVSYLYRAIDNDGAGSGLAGNGGAGA